METQPAKRKTPKGGARKGAGRKAKAATILRRKIAEHGVNEADYAFSLCCAIMHDDAAPRDERLVAAREVMNRVLGKPAQSLTVTTPKPIVVQGFDYNAAIAAVAPGSISNHGDIGPNVSGGDGPAVGENVDGGN